MTVSWPQLTICQSERQVVRGEADENGRDGAHLRQLGFRTGQAMRWKFNQVTLPSQLAESVLLLLWVWLFGEQGIIKIIKKSQPVRDM
jgi:hypothetical protein